jgi:hypothetical protein
LCGGKYGDYCRVAADRQKLKITGTNGFPIANNNENLTYDKMKNKTAIR